MKKNEFERYEERRKKNREKESDSNRKKVIMRDNLGLWENSTPVARSR